MKSEEGYQTHFIHIEDIKRFLKKRTPLLFCVGAGTFILSFLFFGSLEMKFQLKSSFKEAALKSDNSSSQMLKSLLKQSGNVDIGAQALTMMKSRFLLEQVIKAEGIQAEVKEGSLWKTLKKRWAKQLSLSQEKVFDPKIPCRLKEVTYLKPFASYLKIKFPFQHVALVSYGQEIRRVEDFSQRVVFEGLSFLLEKAPYDQQEIIIEIIPLEKAIDKTAQLLSVKLRREDNTLLDLFYKDKDPTRGMNFLNRIMSDYKNYLVEESQRVSQDQLSYLLQRQEKVAASLDQTLEAHVKYLKETLGEKGFLSLAQELEKIEKKKSYYEEKKGQLQLQLATLDRLQQERLFCVEDVSLGEETKKTQQLLLDLKKQKQNFDAMHLTRSKLFLREDKRKNLLWKEEMQVVSAPPFLLTKLGALKLEESILELKPQNSKECYLEFQGLDQVSARELYSEYIQKLEEQVLRKKWIEQALYQMRQTDFVFSELSDFIEDSMSEQIFKEGAALSLMLQNDKYLTEKDRKRLKEELDIKKQILLLHLEHKLLSIEKKIVHFKDKSNALQQVMLDLVSQEIEIVEEQMLEQIQQKKQNLILEQELTQQGLENVQLEMQEIPSKWLLENKLQLQADLNLAIMEGMAQLVESKNIEHHLLQVESKTIDKSYIPILPKTYPLILYSCLMAFLSVVIFTTYLIAKKIYLGFPLSLEGLRFRGFDVVGPLHVADTKNYLENLRKIAEFIWGKEGRVVSFILNNEFNYTCDLANLMRRSGKKILIVECFMKSCAMYSLQDLLNSENQGKDIDRVAFAKDEEFGLEFVNHEDFSVLFTSIQQLYFFIFFVTDKKIDSIEAHKLRHLCEKMVLTLREESFEDLHPYIREQQEKNVLTITLA